MLSDHQPDTISLSDRKNRFYKRYSGCFFNFWAHLSEYSTNKEDNIPNFKLPVPLDGVRNFIKENSFTLLIK